MRLLDVFLARQPIFDNKNQVYGYEILYRDGEKNSFSETDGDYASISVLTRCFIDFGIEEMTHGKKAFVNFTEELLKNDVATIFPQKYLVVEILENVLADRDIIECCKDLKDMGYMLAIDDFTFQEGYKELIDIVDIIKVDFTISSEKERFDIINNYKREGLKFLAEKVETYDEYYKAMEMGYSYFQGYYFSKPEINSKKKIVPYKESHMKLIKLLDSEEHEFNNIVEIIENDVAFSYEILKLVNSSYYSRKFKIKSIRQAIVSLGTIEIKKWIYLAFIRQLNQDKPEEIINTSILRGKFMENIAIKAGKEDLGSELLTLGMFSMIDVLMNKDIEEIFKEINFSDNLRSIITKQQTDGFQAKCFDLALKYEKGKWQDIEPMLAEIGLSISELNEAYFNSIAWLQGIK